MGLLFNGILVVHVLIGIAIIVLVLLQQGKGADMGAAFGSGASGSLFGASGSANFLSRATAVLATVFFLTSLGLSYLTAHTGTAPAGSVMDRAPTGSGIPAAPTEVPAVPRTPSQDGKEIPR